MSTVSKSSVLWSATAATGLAGTLALTGCASHNYDFAAVAGASPDDPGRVAQLVADLDRQEQSSEESDDTLYDVSVFPLVHSELHVFARDDDADTPAAFVEADVAACLPLFGVVDATVTHYDDDHRLLSRHELDSTLWGAFRNHRETISTHAGQRQTTHHTFLWLFTWCGEERWATPEEVAVVNEEATPHADAS